MYENRNALYESLLGVLRDEYRKYNVDVKFWSRSFTRPPRGKYYNPTSHRFVDGFTFTSFANATNARTTAVLPSTTAVPVAVATTTTVLVEDTPTAPVKTFEMAR